MAKFKIWANTSYLEESEVEAETWEEAVRIVTNGSPEPTKRKLTAQYLGSGSEKEMTAFRTRFNGSLSSSRTKPRLK